MTRLEPIIFTKKIPQIVKIHNHALKWMGIPVIIKIREKRHLKFRDRSLEWK
jgi:hypothetical protein